MADRTMAAMFDRYENAAEAVRRLEGAGVPHGDIGIVSNDESHAQYHGHDTEAHGTGLGAGASLGTLIGGGAGLLAGLGLLAIPGLGPVVAAGWLASTLVGAGVGAAAGGLTGSLVDVGVSEEDAHAYAEGVRRGGTLVTVRADDAMATQVIDILDRDGTIDMDDRTRGWRGEGWSGTAADDATSAAIPAVGTLRPSSAAAVEPGVIPQGEGRGRVRVYGQP